MTALEELKKEKKKEGFGTIIKKEGFFLLSITRAECKKSKINVQYY